MREGAYDNVAFHRVIDGFMAQTGDVQFGDMEDGYNAAARRHRRLRHCPTCRPSSPTSPIVRGIVGMARSQDPNSANSQFFIMFAPNAGLDGQYTVVGKVESGMEFVDKIKKGDDADNGAVTIRTA